MLVIFKFLFWIHSTTDLLQLTIKIETGTRRRLNPVVSKIRPKIKTPNTSTKKSYDQYSIYYLYFWIIYFFKVRVVGGKGVNSHVLFVPNELESYKKMRNNFNEMDSNYENFAQETEKISKPKQKRLN